MKKFTARHGDIYLEMTEKKPEVELVEQPNRVVAFGEATGHSHKFEEGSVMFEPHFFDRKWVELTEATGIIHDEHHRIEFPPGIVRSTQQRRASKVGIAKVID